jgi:hypothetical protein
VTDSGIVSVYRFSVTKNKSSTFIAFTKNQIFEKSSFLVNFPRSNREWHIRQFPDIPTLSNDIAHVTGKSITVKLQFIPGAKTLALVTFQDIHSMPK